MHSGFPMEKVEQTIVMSLTLLLDQGQSGQGRMQLGPGDVFKDMILIK